MCQLTWIYTSGTGIHTSIPAVNGIIIPCDYEIVQINCYIVNRVENVGAKAKISTFFDNLFKSRLLQMHRKGFICEKGVNLLFNIMEGTPSCSYDTLNVLAGYCVNV